MLETESTELEQKHNDEIAKLHRGDELPPGVIKKVTVYVAIKRKLQPGDKMAVVTVTKVLSLTFFQEKICHTLLMVHQLKSYLTH